MVGAPFWEGLCKKANELERAIIMVFFLCPSFLLSLPSLLPSFLPFAVLGFELRAYTLSHSAIFLMGFFKIGS
jgi:hypothetical protein